MSHTTRFSTSKAPVAETKRAAPAIAALPTSIRQDHPVLYRPLASSAGSPVAQLLPGPQTNIRLGAPPVYRPQYAKSTVPPVYRPEPKKFMQPKLGPAQRSASSAAPPVYHPQSAKSTVPPVYRPEPKKFMQPQLGPVQRSVSSDAALIFRQVMPPLGQVQTLSKVVQQYTTVKGKGKQGGNFINGNEQIHLHIDIGIKSHLKVEGKSISIGTKGGGFDVTKIQGALNYLLLFRDSIVNDLSRAGKYAAPINDCIVWLMENGAKLPTKPSPPAEEEKKVETASASTGSQQVSSPSPPLTQGSYTPLSDDDFM